MSCNLLSAICLLRNVLEAYIADKDFFEAGLSELLGDKEVRVTNGTTDLPEEESNVSVSLTRGAVGFQPSKDLMGNLYTTQSTVSFPLLIEVSSADYQLTELLGVDLTQYIIAIHKIMATYNLNIANIQLSEPLYQREASPNRYSVKIALSCSTPRTQWTLKPECSILRSIEIRTTIK